MRRGTGRFWLLPTAVVLTAFWGGDASAQWFYPGGYGGWGWSQWGADPGAGYMAGLGAYAQAQGQRDVSDAQAQSINADTAIKWNKYLRQRQREIDAEKRKADAAQLARDNALARKELIEDGTSLNVLLDQILEFNADGKKAYASRAPLDPAAVRDIPFESQTEAITVCIDQMTARDGWPDALETDALAPQRAAVAQAADAVLEDDAKGDVKPATVKKLQDAIAALRAAYLKRADDSTIEFAEADTFLKTLAGLTQVVKNPRLKEVLAELEMYKQGDVGDLIGFMHAFNLRFGAAVSERQKGLYRTLYPMFLDVLRETGGSPEKFATAGDPNGKGFRNAAGQAFKDMKWSHLGDKTKP